MHRVSHRRRAALAPSWPELPARHCPLRLRPGGGPAPLSRDPAWLPVLRHAFGHEVYALEAVDGERTCGFLPLAYVRSLLFGRFLVSLPYLNTNGVLADDADARDRLIDRAVRLADELRVRYLELRHEQKAEHPALTGAWPARSTCAWHCPPSPGRCGRAVRPRCATRCARRRRAA